jgi:GNAT superfamily N-acetyltransferase
MVQRMSPAAAAPRPPVAISLEPLPESELPAFTRAVRERQVADAILSGLLSMMQAEAWCDTWLAPLERRPGDDGDVHRVYRIVAVTPGGRQNVGTVWFTETDCAGPTAVLQELHIDDDHRRRGYGRAALGELEALIADLGLVKLQVRVYQHHSAALDLLDQLGFAPRQVVLEKRLGARAAGSRRDPRS